MHFFALARHFIFDIFHFDGKFFDTLRYLFFKPAFVAKEYIAGRRGKDRDPSRMYLFTSAVFFLLFFTFAKLGEIRTLEDEQYLNRSRRMELAMELSAKGAINSPDTNGRKALALLLDSTHKVQLLPFNSAQQGDLPLQFANQSYVLRSQRDSTIPIHIGDTRTWLGKRINTKIDEAYVKYRDNPMEGVAHWLDIFLHRLPYLLFLSLPFFALILKLLYLRNRNLYFFDHAIFTLYHYVFSFILLLAVFGVIWLRNQLGWGILGLVITLLFLSWPAHLFLGMKRFYGQSGALTFGKFLLLNLLGLAVLLLLFLGFIIFSLFSL